MGGRRWRGGSCNFAQDENANLAKLIWSDFGLSSMSPKQNHGAKK